ncbi:MAG: hypothetical protein PHU61_03540 [Candidatus Absconditabacteria bacterium]|nr:hypothetical protein [Candidatus Absconditabacteria bacterium]MDD3868386.1 hypothetical protein [Candidatus Absconditabacteria bacterium]MDD4714469.1 hypothetical protein [Candidatus Absconditabacteria bacterium]
MQKAELDKLLELTAVNLDPEQEAVFLDYFTRMKEMFDEFIQFPLPDSDLREGDTNTIVCFDSQEDFVGGDILQNVESERLVNHAIEVKSAFGA